MGMSALPDIYEHTRGQVHIYRQNMSAHGIANMFHFSLQAHLSDNIFSWYTILLYREPNKIWLWDSILIHQTAVWLYYFAEIWSTKRSVNYVSLISTFIKFKHKLLLKLKLNLTIAAFWVKYNPTITACKVPYIKEEDHSIKSKKSDDF